MEPSDADALHADLVSAFFHPPRIVVCGYVGSVDDVVTIVSHVELWPWRTIVRGSVTRPGSIGFIENTPSAEHRLRQMSWLQEWALVDDVDTEYIPAGAGHGGDGFCSDINVRFRTAVPAEATRLTVAAPGGHRIEVRL